MTGFYHQTALYGSDDEFLTIAVPFVEGGLRAGQPTVIACAEKNTTLLRDALGRDNGVTYLPGADQYARPADAIANYRDLFGAYARAGAPQIRTIGDVPHPGLGVPWDWWGRYENAINQVYAEFPLWGLCPYDTRITPAEVLADVARTHEYIATASGEHLPNADFGNGLALSRLVPDVLERGSPLVTLIDPTPAAVREAVNAAIGGTSLSDDDAHDVVYAASEIVTNGLTHGVAPVLFRLWADASRVVVTVTDRGPGPSDPLAGLVPTTATRTAGLGLWILHRTCDYVSMGLGDDGFTVRVSVGGPGQT
ncbi:anti-sigma regulatory factor (Ser/Thr protein kinase) [Lentzea atacamensis]|uniref:Anti-sigma regulatory factor (Ser/Thr protein kinase) n=2 Tax=Lentzea TaxID=165301 RepID=A0A316I0V8_9PSEU|nr:sensor histidine kinase [Lentzea atacamensis]PWK87026.1 anti-sigma regulatory factor (Ser/Thr protein kinase) [Lentzea atacamensis]RAS70265.1 anti-sigma regulatory factor (Ser/Thr protein kinase) [Lentzea atacamensis]